MVCSLSPINLATWESIYSCVVNIRSWKIFLITSVSFSTVMVVSWFTLVWVIVPPLSSFWKLEVN